MLPVRDLRQSGLSSTEAGALGHVHMIAQPALVLLDARVSCSLQCAGCPFPAQVYRHGVLTCPYQVMPPG